MAVPRVVLVADDEALARELTASTLTSAGFEVIEAENADDALELIRLKNPAVVLMDVKMTGRSGFEAVRELRARSDSTPVLMLTGHDDINFKVQSFSAGADDYVSKDCDPRELIARVEALLRRSSPKNLPRLLRFGPVTVDLTAKVADDHGQPLKLTRTEFTLLSALAGAGGAPISREQLLQMVWGYGAETKSRTVETHVWRLRKKIGDIDEPPHWILNATGLGYSLNPGTLLSA